MALAFIATFAIVFNIQNYLNEDLAKATSESDVKFLDVKWGRNLTSDGASRSVQVFLDVEHKVYIKVYIDDEDFCYQKYNTKIYGEGAWGCNEECNVGECKDYELFMANPTTHFSTNRDKIIRVCWLRTPNIGTGTVYSQYEKCEIKLLNSV